jgi:pyruvate,water dikinase
VARVVGHVNKHLEGQRFILMGPGRWGSADVNLGVKVTYADIHNASALVEVALARGGHAPEVSYGTHFFQDLVESQIYPLPLYPDGPDTLFNWKFFDESPNALAKVVPECAPYADYVKLIDVPSVASGRCLKIVMNDEEDQALAYLNREMTGK